MFESILIIPWENDNDQLLLVLRLMLSNLGYKPVFLDVPNDQIQSSQIENACLLHQAKVIITYLGAVSPATRASEVGNRLCKMLRTNPRIKNVSLLYLFYPTTHIPYEVFLDDRCYPNEYLRIVFSEDDLKIKLQLLLDKNHE